jgi:hypothetical protein
MFMNDYEFKQLVDKAIKDEPSPQGSMSDQVWNYRRKSHLGEQNFGKTAKPSVMEWVHEEHPEGDWKADFQPYDYDDTAWSAKKSYTFDDEKRLDPKTDNKPELTPIKDVLKGQKRFLGFDPVRAASGGGAVLQLQENDYTRYRYAYHRYSPIHTHQHQESVGNGWNILAFFGVLLVGVFFLSSILLLIIRDDPGIGYWSFFTVTSGIVFLSIFYMRWYRKNHDMTYIPHYSHVVFDRKSGFIIARNIDYTETKKYHYSEFVPVMFYTVSVNAVQEFHLLLFNRISGNEIHINTSGDIYSLYVTLRIFNQFMDINEPLPDLPHLEPFRPFDKTTREYDKKRKRDPDKWRSADHLEYHKMCEEARRYLQKYFESGDWI